MANSHQGNLSHGIKIIEEMSKISKKYNISGSVKLQFRNLDTFIHPKYINDNSNKNIARFLSTKLKYEDFLILVKKIKENGLTPISTPFDEDGVDWCVNSGIEIIKIASCSAHDWPLLEKIALSKKPVIISTGGKSIKDIDKIYNFFKHKNSSFSLLHCTSEYPVLTENIQMDFIDKLKQRYKDVIIGYSGHEQPNDNIAGMLAYAKGAKIFERHVGLPTENIKLNAYSMNPEQTEKWVNSILMAQNYCQLKGDNTKFTPQTEIDSLRSLMRGVYTNKPILKGNIINKEDVFFAMPLLEGQLSSGEFRDQITASVDYSKLDSIKETVKLNLIYFTREIIHEAKSMLSEANIYIGKEFTVELSHHYGLENFRLFGATIINLINREYCKKLIIVLPSQQHPNHYHVKKEETFQLLYGDLKVHLDDQIINLSLGEILTVKRNQIHSFSSKNGAIFEEISTTHIVGDSYYLDEKISKLDLLQRKTYLEEW